MRTATNGNYAIIEYPQNDNPSFEFDNDGVIYIFGYSIKFLGGEIGSMQRVKTGLKNYKIVGTYKESIIAKEVAEIVESCCIDINNCVILIKK